MLFYSKPVQYEGRVELAEKLENLLVENHVADCVDCIIMVSLLQYLLKYLIDYSE